MITFVFIITGIYAILILSFSVGFKKVSVFKSQKKSSKNSFSIVIPFRNEAENLQPLLDSIKNLKFTRSQYECIFIDDESTDDSVNIIHQNLDKTDIQYSVIPNFRKSNSPKKDAINSAIKLAKYDWIITTDADCIVPEYWLYQFDEFSEQNNSKMIVGPVMYQSTNFSFLESFQLLDFLSLQGATLGGFGIKKPFLCNGANLAYKKDAFIALKGFHGNEEIASGDDIFLFEKFYKKNPTEVHFLKSKAAIVKTKPVSTCSELIQQRMRWAAKSSSYNLKTGKIVGIIVLLTNVVFIISMIEIFSSHENSLSFLYCLIIKILLDFILIKQTSLYYIGSSKKIRYFELGSLFYPFFSIYIVLRTITSKYNWKGRNFKK
tara:strand:- start:2979 stop:4109 length:1131 start_codon:yes stop_codon:yes gene_type:complete